MMIIISLLQFAVIRTIVTLLLLSTNLFNKNLFKQMLLKTHLLHQTQVLPTFAPGLPVRLRYSCLGSKDVLQMARWVGGCRVLDGFVLYMFPLFFWGWCRWPYHLSQSELARKLSMYPQHTHTHPTNKYDFTLQGFFHILPTWMALVIGQCWEIRFFAAPDHRNWQALVQRGARALCPLLLCWAPFSQRRPCDICSLWHSLWNCVQLKMGMFSQHGVGVP